MRVKTLCILVLVTAIGYALKFYRGPGQEWVNNWGPASIAYEMILMLTVFLFTPKRRSVLPIAVGVCLLTCVLEFMQLWKPPWLEALRSTMLGRALLGNTFSWWDLPAYPIGCVIGYFVLLWLAKEEAT